MDILVRLNASAGEDEAAAALQPFGRVPAMLVDARLRLRAVNADAAALLGGSGDGSLADLGVVFITSIGVETLLVLSFAAFTGEGLNPARHRWRKLRSGRHRAGLFALGAAQSAARAHPARPAGEARNTGPASVVCGSAPIVQVSAPCGRAP